MKQISFVLAAVILSNQLLSQTGNDSTVRSLDEAVITANKYPSKLALTGKVISVITREQIDRAGNRDLSQLLTEQTGIYIAGANSNAGKDKNLYIRGARTEHSLILIDGVPVYDPSGIGGNFDLRNLALANIERIEILKGSQSTLYGSDAIAGVINIITRKSTDKNLSGQASALAGSNSTYRVNTGIYGKQDKVNYDASFSYHHTGGISEAINKSNNYADKDDYNQLNVQAGLTWKPGYKVSIRPFIRYAKNEGNIDQGAFTDELDYDYLQKSWQLGLQNEFLLGTGKLVVQYQRNTINRTYTDDSTLSRNGYDAYTQGIYRGREHFAEALYVLPLPGLGKLTTGVDYRRSFSDQRYFSFGFFGPYEYHYADDSLNQRQVAIYSALAVEGKSGFHAELGARVNFHNDYGSHFVFNVNPSWLINQQWKLFVNVASGYRTPSLYQLYAEYGNRHLKPEASVSIDGGLQYFTADKKFNARAVYFTRNVKDIMFFSYDIATMKSQYINQDKQEDHGFDLELSYNPCSKSSIKGFYSYVTGKINTKVGGRDTTYNNLLRRPTSTIGVEVFKQLTSKFSFTTGIRYASDRKDAYFDNSSFTTKYVTLASYALWDLGFEYKLTRSLGIFADLHNITGTKYTEISGFNTLGFNGYGGVRVKL